MTPSEISGIVEAILFVSGKEVELNAIAEKMSVTQLELAQAIALLKEKYSKDSGIHLLSFSNKLQLSSNPALADSVASVLNPIREKELSKATMETLAIVAYKQPVTRLEIEEIRGVDSTYTLEILAKMSMIKVVGRKDAVGKPLLFGTSDEFLKRFSLEGLKDLPNVDLAVANFTTQQGKVTTDLFLSNKGEEIEFTDEDIPDFLKNEVVEKIF